MDEMPEVKKVDYAVCGAESGLSWFGGSAGAGSAYGGLPGVPAATDIVPVGAGKHYLFGIAANVLHEHWAQTRRQSPSTSVIVKPPRPEPSAATHSTERLLAIRDQVKRLPLRQRRATELVYFAGN